MPDTDVNFAHIVAERLRQDIAGDKIPVNNGRTRVEVTVSIGIASTEDGTEDDNSQKLIKRADEALYAAKQSGRNRVNLSAA